jgi:hypothetical protein
MMIGMIGVVTENCPPDERHQAALTIAEMTESHGIPKSEGLEILRMLGLTDETDHEVIHGKEENDG